MGDSSADIEAANAAGCWSCLAAWGVSENVSESIQKKADFIAKFPEIVLRLTGGKLGIEEPKSYTELPLLYSIRLTHQKELPS